MKCLNCNSTQTVQERISPRQTIELRAYVLAHRDDGEAIRALFSRRSPDETATWYSGSDLGQMEEVLRQKIQEVEKGQV